MKNDKLNYMKGKRVSEIKFENWQNPKKKPKNSNYVSQNNHFFRPRD